MKTNQVKPIGTIFATPAQLKAADAFSDEQKAIREKRVSGLLSDCERRVECGETRFYQSENKYAVAGSMGKVLWFEIRKGHHYSVRA